MALRHEAWIESASGAKQKLPQDDCHSFFQTQSKAEEYPRGRDLRNGMHLATC